MAHDLFISYSPENQSIADTACSALESDGVRCWIAPRDIVPGQDCGEAIIDAIARARIMVLILSSNSNQSHQILREVHNASEKGLTVIPLRVENITPVKALEDYLGAAPWLDALTLPLETHLAELARRAKVYLQGSDLVTAGENRQSTTGAVTIQPRSTWLGSVSELLARWCAADGNRGQGATMSRIDRKYGEEEQRRPAVSRRKHRPRGVLRQSLVWGATALAVIATAGGLVAWRVIAPAEKSAHQVAPLQSSGSMQSGPPGVQPHIPPPLSAPVLNGTPLPRPQTHHQETFQRGLRLYNGDGEAQDYAAAFQTFQQASDQGDADAAAMIGQMYDNGQGIAADPAQAKAWYQKAVDAGSAEGLCLLGRHYFLGTGESAREFTKSAELFHAGGGQEKRGGDELHRGNVPRRRCHAGLFQGDRLVSKEARILKTATPMRTLVLCMRRGWVFRQKMRRR